MLDVVVKLVLAVFTLVALFVGIRLGTTTVLDLPQNARILGYNPLVRGAGVLAVLGGLGMGGWLAVAPPREENDLVALLVLAVLLMLAGVEALWQGYKLRILLTPDGIGCRSPYWKTKFIPWSEVKQVYDGLTGGCVVRSGSGIKIAVPPPSLLEYFELFVQACMEHLPPDRYPQWFRNYGK